MASLPRAERPPPRPRVALLVRTLWPGSFARIALEETSALNANEGYEGELVAFAIRSRGYHYEDLLAARHVPHRVVRAPRWVESAARRLLWMFTPPIRGPESIVPVDAMLWWAVGDRAPLDIVYAEDQFVGGAAWVRWLLRRTPYVVYLAEPISDLEGVRGLRVGKGRALARLIAAVLRALERRILRDARHVAFISDRTRTAILLRFPEVADAPRSMLVPGCDPRPDDARPSVPPERYALAVSKWDEGRQPSFALDLARLQPAPVILAGSWIEPGAEEAFRSRARTGQEGGRGELRVTGELAQPELDRLLDGAYVYLHWNPEGFGMGVLEAMARGVPVVCTRSAGASELLVDGGGIVLNDPSPAEFARALEALWSDPSRHDRLAREARAIAYQHRWPVHTHRLAEILSTVRRELRP